MGHIDTRIRISNIERTKITEVEALADTDAMLTVLPQKVAQELGESSGLSLRGTGFLACHCEDDEVSRSNLRRSSEQAPQSESGAGEGVVTLETLALFSDPLTGKLKEKRLLLYPLAWERLTSGKSFVK